MKLKTLFTINAVLAFFNALGFIFTPQMLSLHMGELGETASWVSRELGGSVIGFAVIAWLARNITDAKALKSITWGFFVSWGVGFVVVLVRQLSGVVNQNGWGAVILFGLFSFGYGYFLFKDQG
jgi:hypothetical protein